jgi:hypothetical protein
MQDAAPASRSITGHIAHSNSKQEGRFKINLKKQKQKQKQQQQQQQQKQGPKHQAAI